MEKQVNNRIGTCREPFTVQRFDADSNIVLIEDELRHASNRYNTAQVNAYIEDPEEVTYNFISSLNKAFANNTYVEDGGAHYSSKTYRSESIAGTSRNRATHS